jgi:hypothetical protein
MATVKTLTIGTAQHPAQFPIRDFSAATATSLVADVEAVFSLAPGHYEIRSSSALTYKHGPAAAVAGYQAVPHDADTWLGVSVDRASDLVVSATDAGTLWIVPAEIF